MKRVLLSGLTAAALATMQSPAMAQSRVFVAAQGTDGNPCTFALPCRTFQHAHDTVAAGGAIDVLDPAGYGMLIIRKSISIHGHGWGAVSSSGNEGIVVQAGVNDVISLNGLVLEGLGIGTTGIEFSTGGTLIVSDCTVHRFNLQGLSFRPNNSATLLVSNTRLLGNGIGLEIFPINGSASATLEHLVIEKNTDDGITSASGTASVASGPISYTITDSVISHNGASGILASVGSGIGFSINLMIRNVTLADNASEGIHVQGSAATVRMARSSITANSIGFSTTNGAVILSYGDNYIDGNGSNTGVLGTATKQ